mmetsp:Transcript_17205/g.60052  ORF Transcript_17205/g.60052 Transcript_17205/m.60052 type:complete len:471 (-) Transcript_17205:2398-3810(-)
MARASFDGRRVPLHEHFGHRGQVVDFGRRGRVASHSLQQLRGLRFRRGGDGGDLEAVIPVRDERPKRHQDLIWNVDSPISPVHQPPSRRASAIRVVGLVVAILGGRRDVGARVQPHFIRGHRPKQCQAASLAMVAVDVVPQQPRAVELRGRPAQRHPFGVRAKDLRGRRLRRPVASELDDLRALANQHPHTLVLVGAARVRSNADVDGLVAPILEDLLLNELVARAVVAVPRVPGRLRAGVHVAVAGGASARVADGLGGGRQLRRPSHLVRPMVPVCRHVHEVAEDLHALRRRGRRPRELQVLALARRIGGQAAGPRQASGDDGRLPAHVGGVPSIRDHLQLEGVRPAGHQVWNHHAMHILRRREALLGAPSRAWPRPTNASACELAAVVLEALQVHVRGPGEQLQRGGRGGMRRALAAPRGQGLAAHLGAVLRAPRPAPAQRAAAPAAAGGVGDVAGASVQALQHIVLC